MCSCRPHTMPPCHCLPLLGSPLPRETFLFFTDLPTYFVPRSHSPEAHSGILGCVLHCLNPGCILNHIQSPQWTLSVEEDVEKVFSLLCF